MNTTSLIRQAGVDDVEVVAVMVGELLTEIMHTIGESVFNVDLPATRSRLREFFLQERYFVFLAETEQHQPLGFIALCPSYALYAEGAFGTIPEFYVRPAFRSQYVGQRLLEKAKAFAHTKGWTRLEVTSPPLPHFDKTLAFYQREGFSIAGGRKLKHLL